MSDEESGSGSSSGSGSGGGSDSSSGGGEDSNEEPKVMNIDPAIVQQAIDAARGKKSKGSSKGGKKSKGGKSKKEKKTKEKKPKDKKEKKRLKKEAQKKLLPFSFYKETQQVIETCRANLESLEKKYEAPDVTLSGLTMFCRDQVKIACEEMRYALAHYQMRFNVFKDNYDALQALMKSLQKREDTTDSAAQLAQYIIEFGTAVSELVNAVQKKIKIKLTDFKKGEEGLQKIITKLTESGKAAPITDYLDFLKISHFKMLRHVGSGKFSDSYEVNYLPADTRFILKVTSNEKYAGGSPVQGYTDKPLAILAKDPSLLRTFFSMQAQPDVYITLVDTCDKSTDMLNFLNDVKFLDEEPTCFVLSQLIMAIETLHMCGFLHRSIQVSNIVIDPTCRIKLCDFEKSKVIQGHFIRKTMQDGYFRRTYRELKDELILGSPGYAAPEILEKKPYGRCSDLWSLGVCAFKISTGKLPFQADDEGEVIKLVTGSEPVWPAPDEAPAATDNVKQFANALMHKVPARRLGAFGNKALKTHPLVKNTMDKLPAAEIEGGKKKGGGKKQFTNPRHKIYGAATIFDLNDKFKDVKNPTVNKSNSLPSFNDLKDESADKLKENNLVNFISLKFRKLIERIRISATKKVLAEKQMRKLTPPIKDIDYEKKETWISPEATPPTEKKTTGATTSVVLPVKRELFFSSPQAVIDVCGGTASTIYPCVEEVTFEPKDVSGSILPADIFSTICGYNVVGITAPAFELLLISILDSSNDDNVACEVLAGNMVRLGETEPGKFAEVLKGAETSSFSIKCAKSKTNPIKENFIKVRAVTVQGETHFVATTVPDGVKGKDGKVLVGDIIQTVNDEKLGKTEEAANKKLALKKMTIGIAETSPLRKESSD